jgi:formiminotetrahydrofolate cyclodeaminase
MLGWQNSVLGIAYDNALIQLTMIADEALANEYRATINTLLENVFENRISKDSIEKKIAAAKNKSQKEEYRILLDIEKEY